MEFGTGGGGGWDNDSSSDPRRSRKRYHRHTANQIQRLEAMFKECPHPDEKQRLQLSRELGLAPRQIKFWFQNRRTQMKAQHERADNSALRAENDKIRCENIAIREALKNVICPSCGGPPLHDAYFDEHKLRMENAHLKEELDRVSSMAAKYIGRPISQPSHFSSLELSMSSFGSHEMGCSSLDLDLLPASSSSVLPIHVSNMDKTLMSEVATNAMGELLRLCQTNEPLWMKSRSDGRDVLDLETYEQAFPRANVPLENLHFRTEVSRDSGVVIVNSATLVDMFMDSNKWSELFPTIVSSARTIEVISSGMLGSHHNGSLQLMYLELQLLSPLVPTRHFYILRYSQQIEQGTWAVVDVSYNVTGGSQMVSHSQCRRSPSGCLIQDMPNGYSKVTWIEHVEVEDKGSTHWLFRDLIHSGLAFGAERWLATLQRTSERFACSMVTSSSSQDLGGVIPSLEGRRSMMKLAQRMVNNFCASISTSHGHRWTTLSGTDEVGVYVSVHKSMDPGQRNGVALSAATTIWLPVPPQTIFNFFKNDRTRSQWDVLSDGNPVQEVAHITNGSHPGNCISVLRAMNSTQNNMLILQESCIDSSGSLVVYCPVDLPAMNLAMSGEDPSNIPLLPSGFAILPDGRQDQGEGASSSSDVHNRSGGSLVTVAFQILVSSLPSGKLNLESVTTVNNLISTTVHQIKTALNCHSSS
ncbi:homeobox-leucine zipper protein HDG11-like [Cucurbita pepo subsp. pepo]|uniref:homeobox-leucine zipper protein HDG11-like n=1 Tax=Cucurbita pepo subsp. pepo TaxID=3664 RepID=UPI000C9D4235|nr:homeobox-leucine zipper protein HDG11-like [Cucurbita pepo subsp. pepo]